MGVVRRGTPTDWLSVMLNLANHGLGIVTEAETLRRLGAS